MSWKKANVQTNSTYTLPIASNSVLGGVKVGTGLTITEDGTLNSSTSNVAPLSEQITEVELIPPKLDYTIDVNNAITLTPPQGQTLSVQYLNKIVNYNLPAISITTNRSLYFNPSTGAFRTGFGNPINEIILLTNNIYQNGVANYDNIRTGALVKYLVFKSSKNFPIITPKNYSAVDLASNQMGIQSFAFIGNEMWVFDKDIDTSSVYRRDPVTFALIGNSIPHSLGYFNSCDYNSTLNALVTGNGTGAGQYTDNKITIYYNASSWASLTSLNTSNVQYIDIDLNGLNANGNNDMKVQACWGDSNFGNNDIVYIVTNDGRTIRKLILGKGTNNLGSGVFTSGKTNSEFNGTYKILNVWTQLDGGGNVQDIFYYNGAIYNNSKRSIEEGGLVLWKNNLLSNGVIEKTKIFIPCYDALGNLLATVGSGEAITIKENKIYCALLGPKKYFTFDLPI